MKPHHFLFAYLHVQVGREYLLALIVAISFSAQSELFPPPRQSGDSVQPWAPSEDSQFVKRGLLNTAATLETDSCQLDQRTKVVFLLGLAPCNLGA